MRTPQLLFPLDDVPAGEEQDYSAAGLGCPDDSLDDILACLPALDDAFLEALGIDCSLMDVDTESGGARKTASSSGSDRQGSAPSGASSCRSLSSTTSSWEPSPGSGSASPFPRWDVPTKPRRQPAAARTRAWSHPSLSFDVPDGHGVSAVNSGEFGHDVDSKPGRLSHGGGDFSSNVGDTGGGPRRSRDEAEGKMCAHCQVTQTPQWRHGPDGPGTLCNACGIRYRMGSDKLVPEYRPSTSPFFRSGDYSNRNSKVQKLREKKVKALKLHGDGGSSGAPGGKPGGNVDTSSVL
ncbi:GATA transcription factor 11 [Hordeum vulgare]|nr:GATA transcription factor 11 [Hordeum vulgare]KAI5010174.1 hypothetical protein ZWY2020_012311 [Hordeum vulgare]